MKIQLERLSHQIEALQAINKNFYGVDTTTNNPDAGYIYANPILNYAGNEKSYIDIKMETGTGKTFVYTQMMYEMHKQGVFKFVIVVPTPSIKEGTRNFITSDYARQYFSGIPGYENVSIQLMQLMLEISVTRKVDVIFLLNYQNLLNRLVKMLTRFKYC